MARNEKTPSVIREQARLQFASRRELDEALHSLLIDASYHALRGNSDPLNWVLDAARENGAVRLNGITRWVETYLPVRVKDEKFKLNKSWQEAGITSFEKFQERALPELEAAPKFWDMVPKEKAQSIWALDNYLDTVLKTLKKHEGSSGVADVIRELQAVKGRLAQEAIVDEPKTDSVA